ncbi:MAG: hypothetical protein M9885_05065 [Burkholderiaceae bacterium]|nr:hypothetical protein [Burkholderiaceae bacterium]
MTSPRSLLSWVLVKLWSVAVVFAILWVGAVGVAKYRELERSDRTVGALASILGAVEGTAATLGAEAQARVDALDRAGREALTRRMQVCDEEIAQLRERLPSKLQRASAVARGDADAIWQWVGDELAIEARRKERETIARILDYRSRIDEYEKQMRDGPAEVERLRSKHLAASEQDARLERQIEQLLEDHPFRARVFGTAQNAKLRRLRTEREEWAGQASSSKAKHDALATFLASLEKPDDPGTQLQKPAVDSVVEALRRERDELQTRLGQDWLWRVKHVEFDATGLATTAAIIVAVATATPFGIKLVLFYVFAPIATRRSAVALLPDSGGEIRNGCTGVESASTAASSVSCAVTIDSSNELLVHPEYLQSLPHACDTRTQWILGSGIPLSSIAAGLYALTRIRAESPQIVVVSSTRDPLSEVSLLTIPGESSAVLLPRYIVGVLQLRDAPLRITRHWRLFSLHAWLTLQLRYLVFHGPVTVVVKGCRGVRVEAAQAGRSLNPAATVGFSANLRYASRRCETLFAYLSARQPLLNDSFAGGDGYYIYQETPYRRRGGIFGRGLEGLVDAALKPLGI